MSRELVCRFPLFALLDTATLSDWLALAREHTYALGETLFQAGTPGAWAYIVLEGQVRVLAPSPRGGEIAIGLFRSGDLFGEYALLPPGQNTATCRVAAPSRLLRLPLKPLQSFLTEHSDLMYNLKNWLRLHTLTAHLRGRNFLGFLSAPSALALFDPVQSVVLSAARTIQADGFSADRWYFIEQGEVLLHDENREMTRQLGPGDCFGERALLGWPDLPIATALSEVRCSWLPRAVFLPRSKSPHPSFQSVPVAVRPAKQIWIGQQEESDCGVASLAMIAQTHGLRVGVDDLRRLISLDARGASLLDLQRVAQAVGLHCRAVRVEPARLAEVTLPAIAHLSDGHYVVVYECSSAGVVIGDPASGIVTASQDTFRRASSGRMLLCDPPRR